MLKIFCHSFFSKSKMKTKSLLITIPRYTDVYYQKFDPINIDNGNEQVINNIVCSIDTTSLYNIRETNTIGDVVIHHGYYPISKLSTLLSNYFTITDSSVTVKQDVDLSQAPSIQKILFHTNNLQRVVKNYTINIAPDESGGLSVIKIFSNIVKDYKVTTSLIDIPIYVSIGLDNVISRNNLNIPCYIPNNTTMIKFYMTDIYDDIISLSQPVYLNIVINYD